ncbi:MAG: hypothetical protein V5A68_07670 [Candidatus Thermoplasmatota archaeon]
MPGFLVHLSAGIGLFALGSLILKSFYDDGWNRFNVFLLLAVCIVFSIIPDFPLGLYYIFDFSTFTVLCGYHSLLHKIVSPVAILGFVFLHFKFNSKREVIWFMGVASVLIHIVMDMFIQEHGVWY